MNAPVRKIKKAWIEIGEIRDIPLRGSHCVSYGEKTIAVFRTSENDIYALEDNCPHKNGPLSQGIVHDGCVTCPLHNWVISLETGQAQGADNGQTNTFPIKVQDQKILIQIS